VRVFFTSLLDIGDDWDECPIPSPLAVRRVFQFGSDARMLGWTASMIKLAIAADLFRRNRAGRIILTAAERDDIATMLNFSDNEATDRLWKATAATHSPVSVLTSA
jgi:hypothetical protein